MIIKKRTSGPRVTGKGPLKSTAHIVYGNDTKPAMEPGDIYATLKNYRETAFTILPEYKTPSTMSEIEFAAFKVVCFAKDLEAALKASDAPAAALIAMHLHDAMMHIRIRKEKKSGDDVKNGNEKTNALSLAHELKAKKNSKPISNKSAAQSITDEAYRRGMLMFKTQRHIQDVISEIFPKAKRGRPRINRRA